MISSRCCPLDHKRCSLHIWQSQELSQQGLSSGSPLLFAFSAPTCPSRSPSEQGAPTENSKSFTLQTKAKPASAIFHKKQDANIWEQQETCLDERQFLILEGKNIAPVPSPCLVDTAGLLSIWFPMHSGLWLVLSAAVPAGPSGTVCPAELASPPTATGKSQLPGFTWILTHTHTHTHTFQ